MSKTSGVKKVVTWWNGLSKPKKRRVLIALASVFVTSYFVGWYLGRDMSPKYDTEGAARIFIASNLRVHSLSASEVVLSVNAGLATYTYTLSTDAVEFSLPPAHQVAKMKPPRRNPFREEARFLALAGIVAAPSGTIGALSTTSQLVSRATLPARIAVYVAAAVLCATGGVLGFWMGYRDDAAYDTPVFERALQDPKNWRAFAEPMRECKEMLNELEAIKRAETLFNDGGSSEVAAKTEKAGQSCRSLLVWAMQRR